MRAWRVVGVCVVAVAFGWTAPARAGTPSAARDARVPLLDVPYVPQSGALCGGAALAMVLRYWGRTGVLAEDFATLVEPGQAGIRTGALVQAVLSSGWTAHPLSGTPTDVAEHLAQARPIIALIRTGSGSYHYVVLVAWTSGWVILHDPNVGPFRVVREAEFDTDWSGSGRWALLILPPPGNDPRRVPDPEACDTTSAATDRCGTFMALGILAAERGDTAAAEVSFRTVQSLCPSSAAPLRERAGLRFRAEDWAGASRLAECALALDPSDAHSWRLLAGSRYLAGDAEGALTAWNQVAEPRTDLTRVDGLARIRYSAVTTQLHLPPGRLLTSRAYRHARRRLAEMPAQSAFMLSFRPLPQGSAQVDVTLLERPLVFEGPWDVTRAVLKAALGREVSVEVASPTGNGELWNAGWRWWRERPRVAVAVTAPAPGGRPGVWRVEGSWERQAYASRVLPDSSGIPRGSVSREERRRTALEFSDWLGPDVRLRVGAALDEWVGREAHLSVEGGADTRWARDRLSVGAEAARWMSVKRGAPFGTAGLSLRWCSAGLEAGSAWESRLGLDTATSNAPLALWSGAGTGYGRLPLLRAHPLLSDGVVVGRVFGRTLVHGTVERQVWPWTLGPVRLGWALFVDAARSWNAGRERRVPWQVDGGTGLRVRSLGMKGRFRIDLATGFGDGRAAVSVGWQTP